MQYMKQVQTVSTSHDTVLHTQTNLIQSLKLVDEVPAKYVPAVTIQGFLQEIILILLAIIYYLDTIEVINTCTIISSASNQLRCQYQYENNNIWHQSLQWRMEVCAWHTWKWCTQLCPLQLVVWLSVGSLLDVLTLSLAPLLQIMINKKAISNQIHCHYRFENNKSMASKFTVINES